MGQFSTTIHYANLADLKERLHDMLDELENVNKVAASEMPIGEFIEYARDRVFREMNGNGLEIIPPLSSYSSVVELAEPDEPSQDEGVKEDPEAFKEASIERLKEIYVKPGGAKLIDRLIKKHGGGETLFLKISADRYPMMMADLDAESKK